MADDRDTAALAHDIRNILTPALLAVEALSAKSTALDSKHTDRIFMAIDKTVALCREAMTSARTQQDIRVQPCRLTSIIREATSLAVPDASVNLIISQCFDGDDAVVLDRTRVLRMAFNLIRNAADALGGDFGHIDIEVKALNGELNIHIRDDGPGLPSDVLDRLFPNLLDETRYCGRIGLGLPTTAQAAAALGGQLILRSTSGHGTHFVIRLPYEPVTVETAA
ncbi:MAG: HAMP domain-containing sensor histidine kinase [Pseudomonadota bacterium]